MKIVNGLSIGAVASTLLFMASIPAADAATTSQQVNVTLGGKQVLSLHAIVAPDPTSHQLTTWIPAQDVKDVASDVGLSAEWVDGVNQLVLMLPVGNELSIKSNLHYHAVKQDQFVTLVNSTTMQYGPLLQKNGTGGTTYLPLYYVKETFDKLGIKSKWTTGTWALAGKLPNPPATPISGDLNATFSLALANTDATKLGLPTPPVPPAAPVTVTLPMNPLFQTSSISFTDTNDSLPMEDYIQSGQAEYAVNAHVADVEAWFKKAYQAQGYHQTGSGQAINFKTGDYTESLDFAPTTQPANQQMNVTMSFKAAGSDETLISYWVTDLVLPQRPADTLIPANVTQVDITLANQSGAQNATTSSQSAAGTTDELVTDPTAIKNLVAAVNGLTQIDPPGVSSGGSASSSGATAANAPNQATGTTQQQATMVFSTTDGQKFTVVANKRGQSYLDVQIGNVAFTDVAGSVWKAMKAAVNGASS